MHGETRRDRVHPDPHCRAFNARTAGQCHDPGFCSGIMCLALLGPPTQYRRIVNDDTALIPHLLHRCPGHSKGPVQGNVKHARPLLICHIDEIRRTAETLLKKAGCIVTTATDSFDALAKIADTEPSIIFVDIMMPRLDGYQTCQLIKNNSAFQSTPVIMLSSKDGLFDLAKGRIVGSDQYLTKPFSKDELLSAIRDHVKTD